MKNETAAESGKTGKPTAGIDENGAEQTREPVETVEITAQAIIEIARAARWIDTLEELARENVQLGEKRIGLRRAVRSLEKICCDPRRIAALMLHAADNPDWAWVNFWAVFCPERNVKQMARLRHTNISTVKYYLDQAELPSDIYDFIPENH